MLSTKHYQNVWTENYHISVKLISEVLCSIVHVLCYKREYNISTRFNLIMISS